VGARRRCRGAGHAGAVGLRSEWIQRRRSDAVLRLAFWRRPTLPGPRGSAGRIWVQTPGADGEIGGHA